LLLAATIAAATFPAAASAAGWTPVTGALGSNIDEIAQTRAADGTLELAWVRNTPGASTQDIVYASISSAGVVGSSTVIAGGFSAASNPGITAGPGSDVTVYFGGIQCTSSSSCPNGLFSVSSTDGGATWGAPIELLNADQVYASDVSALLTPGGTPFETWTHTTGTTVHLGTTPSTADYDFQGAMGAGCCGYASTLAADSAGDVQLAWYSNATGFLGVWSRAVDPATGAPSGSPELMPGTVTNYNGQPSSAQLLGRTPIVALPSGGFDVAYAGGYPQTTNLLLWHVGNPASTTVEQDSSGVQSVSLAVDSQSRVWVFWTDNTDVFARRVDPDGTLEPVIDLGGPPGSSSIDAVDGAVDPAGDPEVLALYALSDGTDQTAYIRGPQVAPVTPPVLGKSVDAAVVKGTVLIKLPSGASGLTKGAGFEPLTVPQVLPTGTSIDSRAGTIRLVTASAHKGKTQTATFGGGLFRVGQSAAGLSKGLTTLSVLENAFLGAPGYSQCHAASDVGSAASGGPSGKVLQTLHAHDNGGQFRTRTKASAATVRGTDWTTTDTCAGTLTSVQRGVVSVFSYKTRKTVRVTAGHSFFARLP
jgi:hypothetical protein